MSASEQPGNVVRFVGVYDADGTLTGELRYWIGARFGTAHCSLCDITHGTFTQRSDWRECRSELPVPFDTYHRNDQPEEVRAAAEGAVPVVLAETGVGHVVLLGPGELEECGGSVEAFRDALRTSLARNGLHAG